MTSADLATDAAAAVGFLRTRADIDHAAIRAAMICHPGEHGERRHAVRHSDFKGCVDAFGAHRPVQRLG